MSSFAGGSDGPATLRFTSEPADTVLAAGARGVLACAAAGPARPRLHWRFRSDAPPERDHVLSSTDAHRKQLTNGSLLLENMSARLAGHYQCVASADGVGTIVSRTALVLLSELPTILPGPRSILATVGSPVLLPCAIRSHPRVAVRVDAGPPDRRVYGSSRVATPPTQHVNVTWLKNGSPVRLEGARVTLSGSGALELDPARAHDAAHYACRVALQDAPGDQSVTSEPIELLVSAEAAGESPPRFIATPQPMTVIEGASVTFDCAAIGNPKPEMIWLNNGAAIDLSDLDSRFYLVGSGSLRVQAARALDAGAYTCRALSRLDSADVTTQLEVRTVPRVSLPDGPLVQARTRGDVTLRCDARARPPPVIRWLKDGEPITPNNHDIALLDHSSLRISGVLGVDAGMFQCVAHTAHGEAQAALRLRVLPSEGLDLDLLRARNDSLVPAPTGLRAVIVKHRFVTLSWDQPTVEGGENVTGYVVVYRVKGSERERTVEGPASKREMNIAPLQPRTSYQFTVLAAGARAVSPASATIEVQTQPEEASQAAPHGLSAEPLGPHSIRVDWLPTPGAETYHLHYKELDSGREQYQWVPAPPATLAGLRAAASYAVRVGEPDGAFSSEVCSPSSAPGPVATLAGLRAAASYAVRVGEPDGAFSSEVCSPSSAPGPVATLAGLRAAASYAVRVGEPDGAFSSEVCSPSSGPGPVGALQHSPSRTIGCSPSSAQQYLWALSSISTLGGNVLLD
ncbi:hypothetical protein JYU34_001323 [Plutella xylostella]|uniref:Uncharacterized protein n=1 Tax=Plutella xylostella TaxID=51655 RepID=A0ABQ7R6J6_PLUXY|nr:hypothetical protein JYU34_001323 [Plutella xylostella]